MAKNKYPQVTNTVIKNLLKEAKKNGIQVKQIDKRFLTFALIYKGKTHYFFHKKIGINPTNSALVSNKFLTLKILEKTELKVPKAFLVASLNELKKLLKTQKIKYPFVIKPFDYSLGVAVTANINNSATIKLAYSRLQRYWRKAKEWGKKKKKKLFMVEEYVAGNDYRILVLDNKVVAGTQRVYPQIIGDGEKTVKQLIQNFYQKHSYFKNKNKKPLIDKELKRNLKLHNVEFDTVLDKGQIIRLRQTSNVFGGGITINVTDQLHPFYKKIAIKACQEFNLNLAGIDLITNDISKKDDYRIIEINSFPALDMHENPDQGKSVNVSKLILQSIFPNLK
jgi:D-alanine-D-alanine ligase-like ATP-grasp enzyme